MGEYVDVPVLECVEVATPGWLGGIPGSTVAISHAFGTVEVGALCQCGKARIVQTPGIPPGVTWEEFDA